MCDKMTCRSYTTKSLKSSLKRAKEAIKDGDDVEYNRKLVHEIEYELGIRGEEV